MNISLAFIRVFFVILSILFLTTYTTTTSIEGFTFANIIIGVISGLAFGFVLIGTDSLFKCFTLRTFNIATLGLFAVSMAKPLH